MPDQRVIMLMGLPRSGTTWLGKIFDSHPDTLYRHEPDSVNRIGDLPLLADISDTERYRHAIMDFAATLPGMRVTKVSSTLPIFPKRYYSPPQLAFRRASVLVTKAAGRLFGELPVPEAIGARALGRLPIVWKSVESIGRLGVLSRVLHASPAILILRHPCGYIASVLRGESMGRFSSRTPSHEDLAIYTDLLATGPARRRGLTMKEIRAMPAVVRLAWRWILFNEKAMEDIKGLPRCMHVRYEDVCDSPLAQASALFDFAGLGWNDQAETFIRRSTAVERDAYYSIFRNPLKSAYKWRKQLSRVEVHQVLAAARQSSLGDLYPEG